MASVKGDQSEDEAQEPVRKSRQRDDKVALVFADDLKINVSRNVLCYASPVFEAMFSHNFLEKQESTVHLHSKNYEVFLEFLLCIHPTVLKNVNESNVLKIVPIAEEYQVAAIVTKCKKFMKKWLDKSAQTARDSSVYNQLSPLRVCLRILESANFYNYTDLVNYAVDTVARFGLCLYDEKHSMPHDSYYNLERTYDGEVLKNIREECVSIFERFPLELKYRILEGRLYFKEDNKFS